MGRFISPDSIVPDIGKPQAVDRYAYVFNNPLKLIDTSGHRGGASWLISGLMTLAMKAYEYSQTFLGRALVEGAGEACTLRSCTPEEIASATAENLVLAGPTLLAGHYGDALPAKARMSFSGWKAHEATFSGPKELFRVHDDVVTGEEPFGHWWLAEPPSSVVQFRIDQAVRPEWNAATQVSIMDIPQGASLKGWVGSAAYQGGFYIGGGQQVFLAAVPRKWIRAGYSIE